MGRTLFLAAATLVCLTLANSQLLCRHCALEDPYVGCLPGKSACTPKAGHPCMTITISSRGQVLYLLRGCIANPSRCGMVVEASVPGCYANVTCCSHAAFCNDWHLLPAAPPIPASSPPQPPKFSNHPQALRPPLPHLPIIQATSVLTTRPQSLPRTRERTQES